MEGESTGLEIAIVGLAGRFPGAPGVDSFWENLRDGVESISRFSEQELAAAGVDPATFGTPAYVNARGVLDDAECFDAAFFGYYPREAELMDPQQRLFLECAWEALESAGYDAQRLDAPTGVYAGASISTYLLNNLYPNAALRAEGGLQLKVGNDKDFLATQVSYKLDLSGPSVSVQTACSTSLVAVHLACQGLLTGECDVALAGGSTVSVPQRVGYMFVEGGILSPDGHCRAFDARAQGTVAGEGVGVVVLKRLADALEDGDSIWAVIRGSAINNDGSDKVGFTAPSVAGQVGCITRALAMAGVEPATLGLVEAHGTGTPLGDPIELAALTEVFRASTERRGFCAIGSVKTNIGHLDTAAGVAGLIKATLALRHRKLPASLHFEEPNPKLDLSTSPFYVNATLSDWATDGTPRRAGVSSFGIGGTNAHVVLEEPPAREESGPSRPHQLLLLSARTAAGLEEATRRLLAHLRDAPGLSLADVAYTLQVGRRRFAHRRMLVCRDTSEAIELLEALDPRRVSTAGPQQREPSVAFLFPGQGAQYVGMGAELYQREPIFREQVDECCDRLRPTLGLDLRDILYPAEEDVERAELQLTQTAIAQPALFVVEYGLAKLWMSWGVEPGAMLGHSIGEYVAACVAGVFSLESALGLVATRGRLMQEQPVGSMLAVPLPDDEVRARLPSGLGLAAVNAPSLCVVSGPSDAIGELEAELRREGVDATRLHTSHAFHSEMMDPVLGPFEARVREARLERPRIPYVSNVSGAWQTDRDATDAGYWARHIRQPVAFSAGVGVLSAEAGRVLLEVGPGRTLVSLAGWRGSAEGPMRVQCMRHTAESRSDVAMLLEALGRLWLAGVQMDWRGFHANERRRRVPLPTYPFERQRYWVDPPGAAAAASAAVMAPARRAAGVAGVERSEPEDWYYVPSWMRVLPLGRPEAGVTLEPDRCWLLFVDAHGLGARVVEALESEGQRVVSVSPGESFARTGDLAWVIAPRSRDDIDRLVAALAAERVRPSRVLHLWGVAPEEEVGEEERVVAPAALDRSLSLGFYSLLFLAQALSRHAPDAIVHVAVVTSGVHMVTGGEPASPHKALALGPCRVIPQELPNIHCRSIDLVFSELGSWPGSATELRAEQLIRECETDAIEPVVAYRGEHRWAQRFEAVRLPEPAARPPLLRRSGVYLVSGGLGRIGLELAEHLASRVGARLMLVGRSALPARSDWQDWLATHDEADDVSRKLRRIQRIEELGGEVAVECADVADADAMRQVVARARARFGEIHGVIHAAGALGEASLRFIQDAREADCERQLRPKVLGLLVLEELFRDSALDFFASFSSISSVLGGFRFAAYAAGNLFLDAFAQRANERSEVAWLSIGWDGWRLGGEGGQLGGELADAALTVPEGLDAFERVLTLTAERSGVAHVLVSTSRLQDRVDKWIKLEALRAPGVADATEGPSLHERPGLSNAYQAPRTDLERAIASAWSELLGIEPVGLYDNFFELGGHSLLGTQLIARLRSEVRVELALRDLLDGPTVADLAVAIVERRAAASDREELAELLDELEGLSDESVARALADVPEAEGGDSND